MYYYSSMKNKNNNKCDNITIVRHGRALCTCKNLLVQVTEIRINDYVMLYHLKTLCSVNWCEK